jgi:hypothetical protein
MGSCKATTTSGRECGSPALLEQDTCYFHSSAMEAERLAAASRGGSAPRRPALDMGKALSRPEILDDPMRVAALLESLVGGTVGGKVSPGTLRSVTYALRTVLTAIEAGDVRRRLEELEAAVKGIEEGRVPR